MYFEGNIIYFDPFYFKNGNTSKRKYFLVLKTIDDTTILATLPSSVIHLPANLPIYHGCIDMPDIGVSCYVFKKNKPVCKCGWSFNLDTFLYGNWIDDYNLHILSATYQIELIDYEIIGQLTDIELENVKKCFRNSPVVKRKYRRIL